MNFLLITSDRKNYNNEKVSALKIVNFRLKLGNWPIYNGTRHLEMITKNDKCIVYLAGKSENSQSFVCDFVIKDIHENKSRENLEKKKLNIEIPTPLLNLIFEPTQIKRVVHIDEVSEKLEFIKNFSKRSRGIPFIGGVRNLIDKDFHILSEKINLNL